MTDRGNVRPMQGHIYVVEFQSGMVKVGHSGNPRNRLAGYVREGKTYGNPVIQTWVSPAHTGSWGNESRLIEYCASRGALASGGKRGEYFVGLDFTSVQRYAESLNFSSQPSGSDGLSEQQNREAAERSRRFWREWFGLDRIIKLLPPVKVGDLPRLPEGDPRREAADNSLAEQLDISVSELRSLPEDLHDAIARHVVQFTTLHRDEAYLADLLSQLQQEKEALAGHGFEDLRSKIWDHLDGESA